MESCVWPLQRQESKAQSAKALTQEHRGEVGRKSQVASSDQFVSRVFKPVDKQAPGQPVGECGEVWFRHTVGLSIRLFFYCRGLGD